MEKTLEFDKILECEWLIEPQKIHHKNSPSPKIFSHQWIRFLFYSDWISGIFRVNEFQAGLQNSNLKKWYLMIWSHSSPFDPIFKLENRKFFIQLNRWIENLHDLEPVKIQMMCAVFDKISLIQKISTKIEHWVMISWVHFFPFDLHHMIHHLVDRVVRHSNQVSCSGLIRTWRRKRTGSNIHSLIKIVTQSVHGPQTHRHMLRSGVQLG